MMKIWENSGTEEIGLVTPTPGPMDWCKATILAGCQNMDLNNSYNNTVIVTAAIANADED